MEDRVQRRAFKSSLPALARGFGLAIGATVALLCAPVQAQWAVGPSGGRAEVDAAGVRHQIFLVFGSPKPGRDAEFNDWYLNYHLPDALQLDGWTGIQRFQLMSDVNPRLAPDDGVLGHGFGYLVIFDQEAKDIAAPLRAEAEERLAGRTHLGKAMLSAVNGTFEVAGPRVAVKAPVLPASATPYRPRRYIMLEFSDAREGGAKGFEQQLDRRISEVLQVPGWVAAQRFRFLGEEITRPGAPSPARPGRATLSLKPSRSNERQGLRYLTIWEIRAETVQMALDTLLAATRSGAVHDISGFAAKTDATFWEPISPYVTKEDVLR